MTNAGFSASANMPKIVIVASATSALDVGWRLFREGRLEIGDSVLALTQTEGRGQMRRVWDSPPGNIYAAIRLPLAAPFDGTGAAIATALICARALENEGCRLHIKWPNDLVLRKDGHMGKCGGILLEEREGALLAGIGLDIAAIPDDERMRPGAALPAIGLNECLCSQAAPDELWRKVVKFFCSVYKDADFSRTWRLEAEKRLLWLGKKVELIEGREKIAGIMRGLGEDGLPILETSSGLVETPGTEMKLVPEMSKE